MRHVRSRLLPLALAALALSIAGCLPGLHRSSSGPPCCPAGVCPIAPTATNLPQIPNLREIPLAIDHAKQEVRASAVVQKTDAPRMNDFGSAVPALMGSRGGRFDDAFVFLLDAWIPDIYEALLELGARPRATFGAGGAVDHAGAKLERIELGYLNGDPVQAYVEWDTPAGQRRRAYEDFFIEKIVVDGQEVLKPWTPHFVLHGSGVLNDARTGCLICTHDCPGGLIANNALPLKAPIPTLKANWDLLPRPGTRVTVVLRPVPSAEPRTQGARPKASPPPKGQGAR